MYPKIAKYVTFSAIFDEKGYGNDKHQYQVENRVEINKAQMLHWVINVNILQSCWQG